MKGSIKDVLSRMVMPPDDDSSSTSFIMDVTVDVHLHDHDNQDNCSCCCIRGLEDHIIPSMVVMDDDMFNSNNQDRSDQD